MLYRPIKIGSLELPGNLFLAPVAGYTDRAFRSLCAEQGADFSFTELISAESLYRNPGQYDLDIEQQNKPSIRINPVAYSMIRKGDSEKHYAIQLFGSDPDTIYKAAILLAPLKPDALDINCGCPVPKIVKNGAGSALMKTPAVLGKVVEAAVRASRDSLQDIPVTVKMRSGWDSSSINYAECARIAAEAGAAMISLHPRTRTQYYSGKSDWQHIADLVTRVSVPVTGSGDLYTPEDAKKMLTETNSAAVMFARGSQGNPFIFSATRKFLETAIQASVLPENWFLETSFDDRLATALRHLEMLAGDIGEISACLEMRKQFCSYTKGLVGGAVLREKLVHAKSIKEYHHIVALSKNI